MKILFQGDSITDAGRTGASNHDNIGRGYPCLVEALCGLRWPAAKFEFVNRAIGGNRVVDLYQRWKVDCLNLKPDVLSVLIGVNDTWHQEGGNGVEVPRAKIIFDMLADWTREALPSAAIAICEPFILTADKTGDGRVPGENWAVKDWWKAEIDERRAYTKAAAERIGAIWIPYQKVFDDALALAPAEHWLRDGVHQTPAGHALMAETWIEAMSPLLGQ
ncbi:MAG: SGNH/GDSL hydrolase family protein [Kiritimatiellae bacterium]|nr:SGNH/GDSL hydrolase family protein [Kiritimatiellia bacterium]